MELVYQINLRVQLERALLQEWANWLETLSMIIQTVEVIVIAVGVVEALHEITVIMMAMVYRTGKMEIGIRLSQMRPLAIK